jgi:transcription antitermination factor NusG
MDAGWVVLRTQPRHELLAAQAVQARGVDAYVPLIPRRTTPLFAGYLFARVLISDDLLRIRCAPGVAYVLPHSAAPASLPDAAIAALRARVAEFAARNLTRRLLRPGDQVTVVAGPFRWVDALFDRRVNAAGRVRILLKQVHATIALEIDEKCLKRVC